MRSEIGYELRREFRGQGLMQEALRAVLAFGFQAMGLHSIEAQADARNHGSRRVLERAGFVLEGYLPENYIVGDVVTDGALYGLRARELALDPAVAPYELEAAAADSLASPASSAPDVSTRPTLPPLGPA